MMKESSIQNDDLLAPWLQILRTLGEAAAQEALAQWLAELRKLSALPDDRSISDARGLAATIAYRVCYGWLRRQSPRRNSLRNRLQYTLTRQAGLAIWT